MASDSIRGQGQDMGTRPPRTRDRDPVENPEWVFIRARRIVVVRVAAILIALLALIAACEIYRSVMSYRVVRDLENRTAATSRLTTFLMHLGKESSDGDQDRRNGEEDDGVDGGGNDESPSDR